MKEYSSSKFKQRLIIVIVSYLVALVGMGYATDFQLQIDWFLLLIIPGTLYTTIIPYLKDETIISTEVYGTKDDLDKFFRIMLVLFSAVVTFAFVFGKHG